MKACVHLLVLIFLAMGLFACNPTAEKPMSIGTADIEAVTRAITEVESGYFSAINSGDAEGTSDVYVEGGMYLVANRPPVIGKDAIKALWEQRFDRFSYDLAFETVETRASDDWAVTRRTVTGTLTPREEGEPFQIDLNGVTLYEEQTDGSWKRVWSIYNGTSPLPRR